MVKMIHSNSSTFRIDSADCVGQTKYIFALTVHSGQKVHQIENDIIKENRILNYKKLKFNHYFLYNIYTVCPKISGIVNL